MTREKNWLLVKIHITVNFNNFRILKINLVLTKQNRLELINGVHFKYLGSISLTLHSLFVTSSMTAFLLLSPPAKTH